MNFDAYYNFRLKRDAWMYPEVEENQEIMAVLENCIMKLSTIDHTSSFSLVDLRNLDQILKEMGANPSKRQVVNKIGFTSLY